MRLMSRLVAQNINHRGTHSVYMQPEDLLPDAPGQLTLHGLLKLLSFLSLEGSHSRPPLPWHRNRRVPGSRHFRLLAAAYPAL